MLVPAWSALLEAEPDGGRDVRAAQGRRARRPGWPRAGRSWTATSPSRTRVGSSRPSASSTSRRCWSRGCCCAASSTGSTSPRPASSGWSTTRPGGPPGAAYEAKALFQMKFYALVIWRTRGVIPAMLQLIYLGNAEVLRYVPDEADLLATERKVEAIWRAIRQAEETGDWRPSPSRLCDWCAHQALCPAFGGTPPPLPERAPSGGTPPETSTPTRASPGSRDLEPVPLGPQRGLRPVGHADPGEHRGQVRLDGALADARGVGRSACWPVPRGPVPAPRSRAASGPAPSGARPGRRAAGGPPSGGSGTRRGRRRGSRPARRRARRP